ncbi:hypothetical protein IF1G_00680 [Cordyceps javanica]|uniref:Uncharacterized protein n=1 Tax=Cordyceps javanica TaxID=43265 RepID=A0A545VG97_9HYPO|nr:hypothetical protein IF1G_00680 [Cordyceps javanica]
MCGSSFASRLCQLCQLCQLGQLGQPRLLDRNIQLIALSLSYVGSLLRLAPGHRRRRRRRRRRAPVLP